MLIKLKFHFKNHFSHQIKVEMVIINIVMYNCIILTINIILNCKKLFLEPIHFIKLFYKVLVFLVVLCLLHHLHSKNSLVIQTLKPFIYYLILVIFKYFICMNCFLNP